MGHRPKNHSAEELHRAYATALLIGAELAIRDAMDAGLGAMIKRADLN